MFECSTQQTLSLGTEEDEQGEEDLHLSLSPSIEVSLFPYQSYQLNSLQVIVESCAERDAIKTGTKSSSRVLLQWGRGPKIHHFLSYHWNSGPPKTTLLSFHWKKLFFWSPLFVCDLFFCCFEQQGKLTVRALELLALPTDGVPRLLLDIGEGLLAALFLLLIYFFFLEFVWFQI